MENKIESKRLYFLPFSSSDLDDLVTLYENPKVCEFLPGEAPFTMERITKTLDYFIRTHSLQNKQAIYRVITKDTIEFIGLCGLQNVKEFNQTEVFYSFLPKYWGEGYATECSMKMIELAEELAIPLLIALADTRNIASNKVLQKCGFQENGQVDLWGLHLNFYQLSLERTL
ncbi:MAG: GNAT family N-acetyltransferase [Candidatus Izemoplasmatales bacterium]